MLIINTQTTTTTHTYVHTHTHTHLHTHTYVHTYTHTYTNTHTRMLTCAPYTSSEGMFISSMKMMAFLPIGGPKNPFLLLSRRDMIMN